MIFDRIFLKFIVSGIINTVFGTSVMFILYNVANFGYWFSSASNYILGSILSFFLNKYWTFQVRSWSVFMVISFTLTILVSYFISYSISKLVIEYLLRESAVKIRENIALLTGMSLYAGINYLAQRFIVFKIKYSQGSNHD